MSTSENKRIGETIIHAQNLNKHARNLAQEKGVMPEYSTAFVDESDRVVALRSFVNAVKPGHYRFGTEIRHVQPQAEHIIGLDLFTTHHDDGPNDDYAAYLRSFERTDVSVTDLSQLSREVRRLDLPLGMTVDNQEQIDETMDIVQSLKPEQLLEPPLTIHKLPLEKRYEMNAATQQTFATIFRENKLSLESAQKQVIDFVVDDNDPLRVRIQLDPPMGAHVENIGEYTYASMDVEAIVNGELLRLGYMVNMSAQKPGSGGYLGSTENPNKMTGVDRLGDVRYLEEVLQAIASQAKRGIVGGLSDAEVAIAPRIELPNGLDLRTFMKTLAIELPNVP